MSNREPKAQFNILKILLNIKIYPSKLTKNSY